MDLAGRTLLGKYRIEGPLGQGGMGTVWRGSHVVTARKVAIKVLDERFLSNVSVVQRFGREARAASAIQHPGIVEVLDLDQTEEGLPFLVMEFLEGETIASRIERRKRLPQDEVVRIGTMLLEALEAAHQHGVVHRDLKPDNIYLVPAGRRGEIVKILDFGISHKDDEAQAKLTMTGSVLGTPHYMSPEQAMGETTLDRRVDVYGAGVVLYECLVGDVPFDAPNYNKLLRVILDEEPVPPSQRGALVDPRVEQVILRAIAKDRDQRWQTARELLDALRAATRATPAESSPALAGGGSGAHARRAPSSPSFARPAQPPSVSTPLPAASGIRARKPAPASALDLAVGDELEGLPLPVREPSPSPRSTPPAARSPLRLDGAGALGGGHGALDALDDPLDPGPLALELDEAALAPRATSSSGHHRAVSSQGSLAAPGALSSSGSVAAPAAVSGRHRAISDGALGAAYAEGASGDPPAERGSRARTSGSFAAPASATAQSGNLPAVRRSPSTGSSGALPRVSSPAAGGERASAAPPRPGLRERWAELPDGTRRAVVISIAGVLLFVAAVTALRMLVRPGEETRRDEAGGAEDLAATPVAGTATGPEWVLVDVEGVPPGAQLRLDGLPGATLPLRLRRGSRHVLEIRAEGYEDRRIELTARGNERLRADMRPAVGTTQQLP